MAWKCEACERRALVGNTRSHSNIASKKRRKVNLQTKTIGDSQLRLCTRCIRTLSIKERTAKKEKKAKAAA